MYVSNFLSHFKRMLRSYNLIRTEAKLSRSINSFQNDNLEDLILKNTVITTNHLTPELKLRLITPECELWHCKSTESKFTNDPFWGIYWPGGQALSRYIQINFFQPIIKIKHF